MGRQGSQADDGSVDRVSLKEARDVARQWLELAHQGKDPLEKAQAALTFGVVMEAFIRRHVRGLRKGKDMEREIRTELMPRFASRPLAEITRRDVAKMVGEIRDRGAVFQAHHILGHIRTFFNWAIAQEEFGIEVSPCDRMQPLRLIGPKRHRTRVLGDDELRAVWKATERMGYPMGSVWQLLMLTGGRRDEVAGALWPEFDLDAKLWAIPPRRFKTERVHIVPLSDDAMALLEQLPRWGAGNHLFSTTDGAKAVNGFSKAKRRLDELATEFLDHPIEPWVTHDLRRTVRTRLSQLKVPYEIAELVIGHARQGLHAIYDQHEAIDERREALKAWARKLRLIIEPPSPGKVLDIEKGRRARA